MGSTENDNFYLLGKKLNHGALLQYIKSNTSPKLPERVNFLIFH